MDDAEDQFTLPGAWAQLRVLLGYMAALFGAPGALAARLFLRAATRFEILQWLAPLEALARRLLVIEALGLPPPNTPAPCARLRDAPVASLLADNPPRFDEADPETWRVVFNLWPGARAGRRVELRAEAAPQGRCCATRSRSRAASKRCAGWPKRPNPRSAAWPRCSRRAVRRRRALQAMRRAKPCAPIPPRVC